MIRFGRGPGGRGRPGAFPSVARMPAEGAVERAAEAAGPARGGAPRSPSRGLRRRAGTRSELESPAQAPWGCTRMRLVQEGGDPAQQLRGPFPDFHGRPGTLRRCRGSQADPAEQLLGIAAAIVAGGVGIGQTFLVVADRPPQPPEQRVGKQRQQQQPPQGQQPQVAVADVGPLVGQEDTDDARAIRSG